MSLLDRRAMTTNGPTIDDAGDQSHIGSSVFIGGCVAASLFFIPSLLGRTYVATEGSSWSNADHRYIHSGGPTSCYAYCHLDVTKFER